MITTRQKMGWMALCLITGACARMLIQERSVNALGYSADSMLLASLLILSPIIFLFSAIRVFFNPRVAYIAGVAGALSTLPIPLVIEHKARGFTSSLWTMFNMDASDFHYGAYVPWLIAMVTLSSFIVLLALTRLLPSQWQFRGRSLRDRTWPALAVTLALFVTWYGISVSPYRIPIIEDGFYPEVTVLRVAKRGLKFEETRIALYRDARISKTEYSRRLFQYRFATTGSVAVVDARDIFPRLQALIDSMPHQQYPRMERLRSWNAEGWYVDGKQVLAFTTENHRQPPPELVTIFEQLERLPTVQRSHGEIRDICFGFCYDPWAGLGYRYINQRCRWAPDGKTRTCL